MAVALADKDDEVNEKIDFMDLSFIDLRHFAEDELLLVAQFSGHFPEASFSDIVVPKIDRSCFNESAGSRRQTWSNRGNIRKLSDRRGLGSSKITDTAVIQRGSIGLTSTAVRSGIEYEVRMLDSGTRSGTAKALARLTRNGKVTAKSSAKQSWKGAITREIHEVATSREIQSAVGGGAGIVRGPLSRKRLRQPIEAYNDEEDFEEEIVRTRNRKNFRSSAASGHLGEEALVGVERRRGPLFGTSQLEFTQRPGRGRNRRTRNRDLMELLAKMKGKWASSEKTLKIVDASGFPVGWTVRVGLRYKGGRTLFEYRDWRSPDGSLWSSFKDASGYLLSSIGHHSTPKVVILVKPGGGSVGHKGLPCSKEKKVTDTVGKLNVHAGSCSNEVLRIGLNQAAGGCSKVDEPPNLALAASGVELASSVDELQAGDCQRDILNKGPPHETMESARVPEQHSCSDQITKTEDAFDNADIKESPRILDKSPISTLATDGSEIASHGNGLQPEDCRREILTRESWKSAWVLERQSCGDHMTKTEYPFKLADLKESRRVSYGESASGGMEIGINSGRPKIEEGQCCTLLTPSNDSHHKCRSCGMMFSTLLKLRGHMRRAKKRLKIHCDVCGRHFSSTALLLGHRVQLCHPRAKKITSESGTLQSKGLQPVLWPRSSKIPNVVLALLSDSNDDIDGNVGHASAAVESSKCSKNLRSRVMPKVAKEEVRQNAEKNADPSDIFECETCNKVFNRRSQYWGHQSVHAKQRKKALKSTALSEGVPEPSLGIVVGSESNLAMVVRENSGYEAENKYAVENVFWRVHGDSSPLERPNYELDIVPDETARPSSLHSIEEVTSEIGVLTY